MKILHIISQRPDSTGSGVYLQAILANAFSAGHDNFLIAALQDNIKEELIGIKEQNCRYLHFSSKSEDNSAIIGMSDVMPYPSRKFRELENNELEYYLDRFKEPLETMVRSYQPDILHTHHLWLLSSFVRQLFPHLPMITNCHGSDLRQFQQCPNLRARVLSGCRKIDTILALSDEQKKHIANLYDIPQQRIAVTGAGYNDKLFYPDETCRRSGTILYAGKLSRAKGTPWLIKALSGLGNYPFHLHLAGGGSGDEYQVCLKQVHQLGDKVSVHGALSQDKLAELMKSSALFILPSLHEGLPLVVLEALASSCHVIATDLAGTREILKKVPKSKLTLIEAPHVTDTNATLISKEERFIENIRKAVREALASSSFSRPGFDLRYFTWTEVFKRIEKNWISTLGKITSRSD